MPKHYRALVAAVMLLAAFLGGPAPSWASQEGPQLNPDNRPTPIDGEENGRIPPEKLITVAEDCRVARAAGPSLALLFRRAAADRVALKGADCYRPIEEQLALYQWNTSTGGPCTAKPSYYPDGRPKGTSNHGWGKAVDFADSRGSLTFSSTGYRFLVDHAEAAGWHHPGWARPGQRCAEPWHWEWVGDGGTDGGPTVRADVVAHFASPAGYAVVTGLGAVETFGRLQSRGSAEEIPLHWVIVDATATPTDDGYWLVGGDGGVFTFGDAQFHGSTGGMRLNAPVVGIAPTPTGNGYWLVASDGGVFTFGDAQFHGSTGGMRLNAPVVGIAPTPTGNGYWLVGSDGGVFTFGDAQFHGSTGGMALSAPVAAIAGTGTGSGYWLVAYDGGVFTFGDAEFHGSAAGAHWSFFVDIARTAGGRYSLVAADGRHVQF